jgi:prevent-host-death family protein
MASYSVAEARNRLTQLIAAAERGEQVTITRHGRPVVEIRPLGQAGAPMTLEDFDRLQARVAALDVPTLPEAGADLLRRMRDGDEA